MNFNSILIGSEDPQRLVDYYTKLFGEPAWSDGGYSGWLIGAGALTVGPHDQVKGTNSEPGRIIWNIETPDVKELYDRFTAAGATVVGEAEPADWDTEYLGMKMAVGVVDSLADAIEHVNAHGTGQSEAIHSPDE